MRVRVLIESAIFSLLAATDPRFGVGLAECFLIMGAGAECATPALLRPAFFGPAADAEADTACCPQGKGVWQLRWFVFDYGSAVLSYYKEKSARAMFDEVDEDKSGYLDGNEVAGLCKSLGKKMGDTDIANAMLAMDRDGNNQVSFEEFEVWWNINGGKSAVKRGEV